MKKTILFAAALVAMTACNKSVLTTSEAGYGWINLGVTADTEMVVTKADEGIYDNYYVKLTKVVDESEINVWEQGDVDNFYDTDWAMYSDVKGDADLWKVPAGNYKVYVKSHLDAAAYEGKGKVRVAGDQDVLVNPDVPSSVTVTCAPVNSLLSFAYTEAFAAVFKEGFAVEADSRDMTLSLLDTENPDHNKENASYFDVKEIAWTLTATPKLSSEPKTYTGSVTTKIANWTKVTFTTGNTDGSLTLNIVVNGDIVASETITATVDPFGDMLLSDPVTDANN